MIEVHLAYDIKPGIDEQSYFVWIRQAIIPALKSKGIIEVRAHRNMEASPEVLVVGLWQNLEDWIIFSKSDEWLSLIGTLQKSFTTNLRLEVWGPSPIIPKPLRPPK